MNLVTPIFKKQLEKKYKDRVVDLTIKGLRESLEYSFNRLSASVIPNYVQFFVRDLEVDFTFYEWERVVGVTIHPYTVKSRLNDILSDVESFGRLLSNVGMYEYNNDRYRYDCAVTLDEEMGKYKDVTIANRYKWRYQDNRRYKSEIFETPYVYPTDETEIDSLVTHGVPTKNGKIWLVEGRFGVVSTNRTIVSPDVEQKEKIEVKSYQTLSDEHPFARYEQGLRLAITNFQNNLLRAISDTNDEFDYAYKKVTV